MSERLPQPERLSPNEAQEASLRLLCDRYGVQYSPDHFYVYPADSVMMALWAEGFIGGREIQDERPSLYVGCSPEGRIHS